ncbi:sensor histidine kinase [Fibrella aquatica]|uniref:sensor histidine kinase n=1 Tax=Fibrella aquatica TaxID=3242487 RepID=UPI0035220DB6
MITTVFWKKYLWNNLGFADLDSEEYTRRTTAVQLGFFTAISGAIYCLIYVWLGFPGMTLSSASYIVLFLIALTYLAVTHNFNVYKHVQLGLILLAPLANHLIVGGFVESSSVILASFITPVIALTFVTRKTARLFFFLFIAITLIGGIWELLIVPPVRRLPDFVISLFFTANIIFICVIIYFLIDGFLRKQEELRTELRQSLETLRATQNQLIHAEKMASLGELTAGIAHEIQNPLNFVNNFSEVSVDLIQELDEERQRPVPDHDLEAELLDDLKQNLQKIELHGKRASSIVRGMLEHSRASSGQRTPTDLNALADEYLKLAYHGMRAKDKSFTAQYECMPEPTLEPVSVMAQDISRVLLNIFTNAFYAVQARSKQEPADYVPRVTVQLSRKVKQVVVTIQDNGSGMPEEIKAKIFQPFFTTKPTGQGTGLGLSLAYDIVTKGHNGTIDVVSAEGKGTSFTITIPA